MTVPVLEHLFVIVIGIALLTTGAIVLITKRSEGAPAFRAGTLLMASAIVLGLSFNSVASTRNDYQQATQETEKTGVLEWYKDQAEQNREALDKWIVEFVTNN